MTFKEKKYGRNELNQLMLCPRDVDAVPVKVVKGESFIEYHCKKCLYYGHKDGSLILRREF